MEQKQMPTSTLASELEVHTAPNGQTAPKGPTAKEVAEYEKNLKDARKRNKEGLEDFRVEVEYTELQAKILEFRLKAMKDFMEIESVLPTYLSKVEEKKARDAANQPQLIQPVSNPIITSVN